MRRIAASKTGRFRQRITARLVIPCSAELSGQGTRRFISRVIICAIDLALSESATTMYEFGLVSRMQKEAENLESGFRKVSFFLMPL